MPPSDKKDENEEEQSFLTGVLPSILSGAVGLAGLIPSLLKGPQDRQLRNQQAGRGAGASLARQTASDAAGRVLGASTAQPSSGRGGALREGLRAADRIVAEGGRQAALVGAQEAADATRQLRGNEFARRQAALLGGAGLAENLSTIAGTLAAARDQGEGQASDPGGATPATPAMRQEASRTLLPLIQNQDRATGLPRATTATGQSQEIQQAGQAGLDRIQKARTGQVLRTTAPTGRFAGPGAIEQEMTKAKLTGANIDTSGVAEQQAANVANFSPEQQTAARVATATVEKQNALQANRRSRDVGQPQFLSPQPPPFTDPVNLAEWVYEMVARYNPFLGQGLSPQAGMDLLLSFQIQPDPARLGLQGHEMLLQP